jgi:type II secretory pathway component PulM
MMIAFSKSLSARDRRALLWGAAIGATALLIAVGVKPYVRVLNETRDELSTQRELLARERALMGASGRLPAALRKSQGSLAEESTPLFNAVDELSATSDRVLVQQLETRKAEALDQGMVAVAVDIRAEGDFEGVLRFLDALERGDKLVRVSALTLARVDRPVTPGAPDMEVISVTGTMTGYAAFNGTAARLADTTPLASTNRP